ncbi:MAG TPA: hypothetical protein VMB71_16565 [Acetobacteraceae bacterium]|nr:hypothetical protein [Acetobacteraceae bacterium]
MREGEVPPGSPAPESGAYEELNVFGQPSGRWVTVRAGDDLPDSPRGFRWRRLGDRP